jgi:hypothetical protein
MGAFCLAGDFHLATREDQKMRACFLGQNVFALGYGVATLQSPRLQDEQTGEPVDTPAKHPQVRQPEPAAAKPEKPASV